MDGDVVATGTWLGAAQATLGFALLTGVGASALVYFALLAGWIAAGALGARARSRDVPHFATALATLLATRLLASHAPFATPTLVTGLVCCIACGSYGGFFIATRGGASAEPRRFLLRENNGFVAGFALASVLVFVSIHVLDALVLVGGVALLARKLR